MPLRTAGCSQSVHKFLLDDQFPMDLEVSVQAHSRNWKNLSFQHKSSLTKQALWIRFQYSFLKHVQAAAGGVEKNRFRWLMRRMQLGLQWKDGAKWHRILRWKKDSKFIPLITNFRPLFATFCYDLKAMLAPLQPRFSMLVSICPSASLRASLYLKLLSFIQLVIGGGWQVELWSCFARCTFRPFQMPKPRKLFPQE